ncbi:sporulation lipoprotein, YhcN/YlaJ family [Virgibacillus subterraneus]|uniref:Sporulation lipoprotein, YhcN/YlaJ family n=1 Tax=Virgibacillus subterraneus TaxID=621109 RepID=A0A1H9FRI8_9BACI|nr:YhcN/YlaJ family sporulation lipoprotein [Virgibacillus subterraneus]SEQ40078.1 sporulation lipoprotein, YhcN/YlaJ family [Virgibacillus subterraneus]
MKWKLFSLLVVISIALVACQGNNGNEEGQNGDGNNVEQTRYNSTDNMNNDQNKGNNNGNAQQNGNDEYELAEKAADKISDQVEGIDNAYVLKTENNAYVAAELDNGNANGNNTGNTNEMNNGNGDNINNTNGENNGLTNNGSARENGNNNGDQLTDEVKQEISKIVKSVDNDIDNVYVSTNPDFFDLANNYADDAGNGDPVEGIFDQMGNMIERIFPQNQD